jgi:hypothetical protein
MEAFLVDIADRLGSIAAVDSAIAGGRGEDAEAAVSAGATSQFRSLLPANAPLTRQKRIFGFLVDYKSFHQYISCYQMRLCRIWSRNAKNFSALFYVVKSVTKSHDC